MPSYFLEGNMPRRNDTLNRIEQKILGALTGDGVGGSGGAGGGLSGSGSPEGVVAASPGRTYVDTDAPGTLYFKVSGTGTTGWV